MIVVPVDGSADARRALPLARYLAATFDAPLHQVSVSVPAPTTAGTGRQVHADLLSMLRGDAAGSPAPAAWTATGPPPPPGPPITNTVGVVSADGDVEVVLQGPSVSAALLDYAATHPDAVLCMATHARSGLHRRLVGNVLEELLVASRCPIIAMGPHADAHQAAERPETILLAAGAEPPRATVPLLAAWARMLGAQVVVARVSSSNSGASRAGGHAADDRAIADRLVSRFAQHRAPAMAQRLHGGSVPTALLELAEQIGGPMLLAAPVTPSGGPPVSDITHELLKRSRWPVVASVGATS